MDFYGLHYWGSLVLGFLSVFSQWEALTADQRIRERQERGQVLLLQFIILNGLQLQSMATLRLVPLRGGPPASPILPITIPSSHESSDQGRYLPTVASPSVLPIPCESP